MNDRPTPRTDAVLRIVEHRDLTSYYTTKEVYADFARTLERQLDEAREALGFVLTSNNIRECMLDSRTIIRVETALRNTEPK